MKHIKSVFVISIFVTVTRIGGVDAFWLRQWGNSRYPFRTATPPATPSTKEVLRQHSSSSPSAINEDAESNPYTNNLESAILRNKVFALRHGQSKANVAGLIASSPDIACHQYGLSDVGKEQAAKAGQDLVARYEKDRLMSKSKSSPPPPEGIAILTSDLLRAKETAQLVARAVIDSAASIPIPLYCNDIIIDERLRERGFGEWDGGSDANYNEVWKDDAKDPSHTIRGVESVWSVTDRATECVVEWNNNDELENHWIVCVAHGDVLQILQTAFSLMDPSQHRSLEHLETATLRPLQLKASKQ
ncbi:MAG: hypothetical protein SGARI_000700 [Bacillariaceae sp.]